MVQMLTKLKPLGRPKQPRPTPKLNNTTVRDFGGGLNVVDSEQSLTSKFSPVLDNMVTYTDRRVSPRFGYEMWLKLKQGKEVNGAANISITTNNVSVVDPYVIVVNWTAHPIVGTPAEVDLAHITISGWDITFNGVTPEIMNRTHSVRRVIDADHFEIGIFNSTTGAGTSPVESINWQVDTHMLGGEPVECKYFSNYIVVWTSSGDIFRVDREKNVQRIWSGAIAYSLPNNPVGWSYTDLVASDIFGTELICSNGRNKPLKIDFTQVVGQWVRYLTDAAPDGNTHIPAFDACKSAFRYFTVHDTDLAGGTTHVTEIRIAAKDTAVVYSDSSSAGDAVDINMAKVASSPEQTVRGFATIKDTLLVITPTATTLLKLGVQSAVAGGGDATIHDPAPVDTLNGFGSNAPRSIVEIGSDVFMIDFNGVPSAKLTSLGNSVIPERVSNYIESMMSKHIGRLRKETMRLHTFGFYDGKNKSVHYYLPKYDDQDIRLTISNPFYFDKDMAEHEDTKRAFIMRLDDHQFEPNDYLIISGATGFGNIAAADINGSRRVLSVLNNDYVMIEIGADIPKLDVNGGGSNVTVQPINDQTIGYLYHYVPQLKLFAWSRFKTLKGMMFNCGCGTIEGRSFLFTPDGYMMRYGSPDHHVYADWLGMYDFAAWVSSHAYLAGDRIFDATDGLVYRCIDDTMSTQATFALARDESPDSWEEYKGEPVEFAWELPWADFGARQSTKALRFIHVDASGQAQFKLDVFADNIYKNEATGQLMPARSLVFVGADAGAYGAGTQVYGAGRRTREQRLWQTPVKFKIMKTRITGNTTGPLSITGISFLYHKGSVVRG